MTMMKRFAVFSVAALLLTFVITLMWSGDPQATSKYHREVRLAVEEFMAGKVIDPYRIPGFKGEHYERAFLEYYVNEKVITQDEFDALMHSELVVRRPSSPVTEIR